MVLPTMIEPSVADNVNHMQHDATLVPVNRAKLIRVMLNAMRRFVMAVPLSKLFKF